MNKRQIVASLNQIANELDSNGLYQEANVVTNVMVKISQGSGRAYVPPPNSLGAFFNDPMFIEGQSKLIEDQAKKDIKQKINEKDIEGAKTIYRETLKKLKDPSNFIREVSPTINDPSVPIASLEPMPPYDLVPDSTMDTTSIGKPKPPMSNKPSKPSSKPGMPSKPGSSESSTPQKSEGLSRWVNKAENIYSAWVSKGGIPSTDAEGLIQDIIDYMEKVKLNMRPSLHSAADYKIDKVKALKASIASGIQIPGYSVAYPYGSISGVKPYGDVSGFPGKGVNPFTYDPSKRLTGNALDYQARQEGKSY